MQEITHSAWLEAQSCLPMRNKKCLFPDSHYRRGNRPTHKGPKVPFFSLRKRPNQAIRWNNITVFSSASHSLRWHLMENFIQEFVPACRILTASASARHGTTRTQTLRRADQVSHTQKRTCVRVRSVSIAYTRAAHSRRDAPGTQRCAPALSGAGRCAHPRPGAALGGPGATPALCAAARGRSPRWGPQPKRKGL